MNKSLGLVLSGLILLVLSAGLGIYSNAIHDSAQCISTFEGQNSFVCRVGRSSTSTVVLQGLFFIGLIFIVIGAVQYLRNRRAD